jgi:hypothetical protein
MAKSEYRNPKQIRMIQLQNLSQCDRLPVWVSEIRIFDLELVSNFEFRISNFVS